MNGCSENQQPVSYNNFGNIDSLQSQKDQNAINALSSCSTDSLYIITDNVFKRYFNSEKPIKTSLPAIVHYLNDSCLAVYKAVLNYDSLGCKIFFVNGKLSGYRFIDSLNLGGLSPKSPILKSVSLTLKKTNSSPNSLPKIMVWAPVEYQFRASLTSALKQISDLGYTCETVFNAQCLIDNFVSILPNYRIVITFAHGGKVLETVEDAELGAIDKPNGEVFLEIESGTSYDVIANHFMSFFNKKNIPIASIDWKSSMIDNNHNFPLITRTIVTNKFGPFKWSSVNESKDYPYFDAGISSEIFRDYIQDTLFNNALVLMNTCFSNYETAFGKAFIKRGASAIIGWDNTANGISSLTATVEFLDELLHGKPIREILSDNDNYEHNTVDGQTSWILYPQNANFSVNTSSALPTQLTEINISQPNLDTLAKYGLTVTKSTNPSSIQGTFKISPCFLQNSNIPKDPIGIKTNDMYFSFYNQKADLSISSKSIEVKTNNVTTGQGGFIFGNNDSFSVYLNENGSTQGKTGLPITYKLATIVSGQITANGIRNMSYGIIMTNKQGDIYNEIIGINQCRVFKDSDLVSEKVSNDTTVPATTPISGIDLTKQLPLDSIVQSKYGLSKELQDSLISSRGLLSSDLSMPSYYRYLTHFARKCIYYPDNKIFWIDFGSVIDNNMLKYKFAPIVALPFEPLYARILQAKSLHGNYQATNLSSTRVSNFWFLTMDSINVNPDSFTIDHNMAVLEIGVPFSCEFTLQNIGIFVKKSTTENQTFKTWFSGQNQTHFWPNDKETNRSYFASSQTIPCITFDQIQIIINSTTPQTSTQSLWYLLQDYSTFIH